MIGSREEYERKLVEIEALMEGDPEEGSEQGARLIALADELQTYEKIHFPMSGTPEGT